MGGLARSVENLALNAAAYDAAANQHLNLTKEHQRAALEKLVDTNKTVGKNVAAIANHLNLTTFD